MKQYSIAVDLDGVLFDFIEGTRPILYEAIGVVMPKNYQPTAWDFGDLVLKEEWATIWNAIRHTHNFWLGLSAHTENVAALKDFLEHYSRDRQVYYVTSRVQTAGLPLQTQCEMALEHQGLSINHNNRVIICDALNKAKLYQELTVGFSIDDKAETVAECQGMANHQAYLLDRAYNSGWVLPRVKNVETFCGLISCAEYADRTGIASA